MASKTYQLETVSCPSCVAKIETALGKTPGIETASVAFNSSRVKVTFDENTISSAEIVSKITKLGYQILSER